MFNAQKNYEDFKLQMNKQQNKESINLKAQKTSQLKFKQNLIKRKIAIEKLFNKSVANKLYIFPRLPQKINTTTISSEDSQDQITNVYQLKKQNKKNKKQQTNLDNYHDHIKYDCHSTRSIDQTRRLNLKNDQNYQSKKRQYKNIINDKTQINSSKKKLIQYKSLGRKQKSLKRNYQKGIIISFRGTQRHNINVSLTQKRIKTQIY